ncbi:hypothetical protein [Halobacterium zhouii]|uniref:hypothetical protein n=1 Tax=Halobacterium zhouii TaxID=2902624 RepID=UPI001E4693BB|nr:hypothetical protein [Halobacterium zhouii]
MVSVVLVAGLVIGATGTGLVLADAVRRELPPRTRYVWTGSVGVVSLGGFLAVYPFENVLYRLYLEVTGSPAIAPQPREVTAALLLVTLAASAVAVLAYGFGSRYGPLKAA